MAEMTRQAHLLGDNSGMTEKTITINQRAVPVHNLEKLLFPQDGITEGDLIDYYRRIADTMLPHIQGRPLTMQRFPDGIDGEGFYQKEAPDYFPDWIERVSVMVEGEGTTQPQIVCQNAATLVYLADQACITPHIWLSRKDKLHHPDKLIFDLDPPDGEFEPVRFAARALHELLGEINLPCFVMTTGSRGLHIVVPLDRGADFDAVRSFARKVSKVLAWREPERLTAEVRKDKRKGRVFLDYLRNSYAQTGVAPYAIRARPGAPVATPLEWAELGDSSLHSQSYVLSNIFRRLGQKDDPWQSIMRHAQSLEKPRALLQSLQERS